MNRRIFLRGLGGAALAAPLLSSLREKSVKGQAAEAPRRLVVFFTHNGCLTDRWFPALEDGALTADTFTEPKAEQESAKRIERNVLIRASSQNLLE